MIEYALITIGILIFLSFPYIFILKKKGINKFIFVSSCIGGATLIIGLLCIFSLPFTLLMMKAIRQLAVDGKIDYILPLLKIFEFIHEYYMVIVYPLLNITLPILIYRRYQFFHKEIHSSSNIQQL